MVTPLRILRHRDAARSGKPTRRQHHPYRRPQPPGRQNSVFRHLAPGAMRLFGLCSAAAYRRRQADRGQRTQVRLTRLVHRGMRRPRNAARNQ